MSESIASHRDLGELFRDLAQRLPHIVPFDYINVVLHEPARDVMRLWLLVTSQPSTISPGLELPVDESPGGLVWQTQQPLIVEDLMQEAPLPDADVHCCAKMACNPSAWFPSRRRSAGSAPWDSGALQKENLSRNRTRLHAAGGEAGGGRRGQRVARRERPVCPATTGARTGPRSSCCWKSTMRSSRNLDLDDVFTAVSACLRKVIQHDGSSLVLHEPETRQYRVHVLDFANNTSFIEEGRADTPCRGRPLLRITTMKPAVFGEEDFKNLSSESKVCERSGR